MGMAGWYSSPKPKKIEKSDTIFVFGSNQEGRHGAGAAYAAWMEHGAVWGQAEGRQGNSYAIPTKRTPYKTMTLEQIKPGVRRFIKYANKYSELTFKVTAIGCGLAGYKTKDIAPMFKKVSSNCILPDEWVIWNHEEKE